MIISYLITGAAIALAFGIVGTMDKNDAVLAEAHYCEMVSLWNSHAHLPQEQRPGWPPYKGECNE